MALAGCGEVCPYCLSEINPIKMYFDGFCPITRCGEAAETAEQCESSMTLDGNIVSNLFSPILGLRVQYISRSLQDTVSNIFSLSNIY